MSMNLNILNLTSGYRKLCLRWTRLVFGVGSKYPSAKSAWNHAQFKHPGDRNPPCGVPAFFSGVFGHVAPSLGGGVIRSTAWPSGNRIGDTTINALCAKWGRTYLGWTEDLNGVRVYTPIGTPPVAQPQNKDWFDMATEEDLRKIVRRPDFVVFWYKNARCEANVAEGTWRVYRTEDEIKHRYDFLTRYDYVVVNQEEPAQLIEAYGARVKNDWENEEKPV